MNKRSLNKNLVIPVGAEDGITPDLIKVANDRVGPIVSYWGSHIHVHPIQHLAASCYLQGCRDMAGVVVVMEEKQTNLMDSFDPVI